MLALSLRRLVQMVFVMFGDQRAGLPDLLRHARASTPPLASPGATPRPGTLQAVRQSFGLDRPMPVQYALMMKRLFVTRDLTSFVNRGAR